MAELLKRQYDIIVLKVEMPDAPRSLEVTSSTMVKLTLQGRVEGSLVDLEYWDIPFNSLGIQEYLGSSDNRVQDVPEPRLPEGILREIFHTFDLFENLKDRPLWVHLVKPYGALRFLPWERDLVSALCVPVLMLPDFIFPPPREAISSLEVAVCASAPLGVGERDVYAALVITVRRILSGSPRKTRVQIFANASFEKDLQRRFSEEIESGRVLVQKSTGSARFETAESCAMENSDGVRSSWLLWMRDALRDRAIDVVHFCCRGHLMQGRGTLLFSESPLDRTKNYLLGSVGANELSTFLTQVGAWSTGFEILHGSKSAAGLRSLVDEMGQSRPGPALMHDFRIDRFGHALKLVYGFLYKSEPVPPPQSSAVFLFCQPYLVRGSSTPKVGSDGAEVVAQAEESLTQVPVELKRRAPLTSVPEVARNDIQRASIRNAERSSPTDSMFDAEENTAPWLAATERFVDGLQLNYQKMVRDDLLPSSIASAYGDALDTTLQDLRAAVADLAKRRGDIK